MFSGLVIWACINWRYLPSPEIKLWLLAYTPELFGCKAALTLISEVWTMLSDTWHNFWDCLVQGQDHHLMILVGPPFQLRICCESMKSLHMAGKEPILFSEMVLTEATAFARSSGMAERNWSNLKLYWNKVNWHFAGIECNILKLPVRQTVLKTHF